MAQKSLRVALVGAGSMGTTHAAGWATSGAQFVGVFASDTARATALAAHYGVRVFDSFEAALSEVDIVDLCIPTDLHAEYTLRAAKAGKHVFCEKPIARTAADGEAMIAACKAAGVRLFVGQVVRFFPQYQNVFNAVRAGQIGDLAVLRLTRAAYRPQKATDNWFMDFARSGGPLLDMLVHDYDYARWLGGEVERVYATVSPPDEGGISDYAHVMLRFRSGAIGHVEGGWCYPPGLFRTQIEAAGNGGLIEWSSDSSAPITSYFKARPGEVAEVGLPLSPLEADPYTSIVHHFYNAILHDAPFAVAPEDALAALRIGLAAIESAQTGKPVTLGGE